MNHADTGEARLDRQLTRENTRTIDRSGGTWLHTSRTNPRKVAANKVPAHISADQLKKLSFDGKFYDFTPIVLENLQRLGIDCLIAIGGVRIFGRDAGFTALYTSYITSARCLIPEVPFDLDRVAKILMEDKRNNSSNYSLVIVSEGATWTNRVVDEYGEADAYGHRKKVDIGHALADDLQRRTGEETIESDLTYDLRSGEPHAIDQIVAMTYANIALDLIRDGATGQMVGVQNGCYASAPLPASSAGARRVDVATLYNTERYRPNYTAKLGAPLLFGHD